jgi:hypothetical protein
VRTSIGAWLATSRSQFDPPRQGADAIAPVGVPTGIGTGVLGPQHRCLPDRAKSQSCPGGLLSFAPIFAPIRPITVFETAAVSGGMRAAGAEVPFEVQHLLQNTGF